MNSGFRIDRSYRPKEKEEKKQYAARSVGVGKGSISFTGHGDLIVGTPTGSEKIDDVQKALEIVSVILRWVQKEATGE